MPLAGPRECSCLQLLACQGRRQPIWERKGRGPGPLASWGLCRGRRQEGSTFQAEWGIGPDRSQIRPSKQTTLTGDRASDMLSSLTWVRPSKISEEGGLYLPELKSLHSCSITYRPSWLYSWRGLAWYMALSLTTAPFPDTHTHTYTHTHTHTHTEASCQSSQNLLFWGDCRQGTVLKGLSILMGTLFNFRPTSDLIYFILFSQRLL